ncbi:hypothetical protein Cgig2_032883 [Carnegiea gigantea]|uniref:Uncharacterized protein n=1 Tax=Carnegiea gigantea TaxID=171969 RepID=A0A9Q1JRU9_9CARY|nr:hypothetical protein Cgig2_032883 [Carnegiea gigantea]
MSGTNSGKGLATGGCRLIRIVKSRPTPFKYFGKSPNPSPNPSPSPIPYHTSFPSDSHANSFSSLTIQTPVSSSNGSRQHDVFPSHSMSLATQLENFQNLDSPAKLRFSRMVKFHGKVVQKITETYKKNLMLPILHGVRFFNHFVICGSMNSRQTHLNKFKRNLISVHNGLMKVFGRSYEHIKYVQKLSKNQATQLTQVVCTGRNYLYKLSRLTFQPRPLQGLYNHSCYFSSPKKKRPKIEFDSQKKVSDDL